MSRAAFRRLCVCACMAWLGACQPKHSDARLKHWSLDAQVSQINYLSNKNNGVIERNHFRRFSGAIENNRARIDIELDSLDTGVPIRDVRVREVLFDTAQHPVARIAADVDVNAYSNGRHTLPFTLFLHGVSQRLQAEVLVQRSEAAIQVLSYQPVRVSATDYGLADGIIELLKLARLQSIDYTVEVEFVLHFNATPKAAH